MKKYEVYLNEEDHYILKKALNTYLETFAENTMTYHDLKHIIEQFKKKEKR